MKRISHIGLDMDHTLVRYKGEAFEKITHRIMLEKLVAMKNYPEEILKLELHWETAIRGLVIDKNRGNLLKLSRFAAIRLSQHGLDRIDYSTQKKIYKSTYIDLSDPEYDTVDTYFSIAFASLFAQLVDKRDNDPACHSIPEYSTIARDLNFVLDRAHRDGSIKGIIQNNLPDFIVKDPEVVSGLQRYIRHNKKIFILTNSDFNYTKLLLEYAIDPFLEDGKTWRDLFEFVITSAGKPRFFYDKLKFLRIDPDTGLMSNLGTDKLSPGVYQGGCATQFTDDLELSPDQILYVGDHIYGDILRLKKDCAWRTALVVEEIEQEVEKNRACIQLGDKIAELMNKKVPHEVELDKLISDKIENGVTTHQDRIDELLAMVGDIDQKISPLIKEQDKYHNPYWGELMRAGIEESYFAYQVERFACIYTSKLSTLLSMSPRTYFRAPKRPMAHEI